jgi:hypothetical protein
MFHLKNMSSSLVAGMGFAALLLVSAPALAVVAVAPPLGVAQQFGALGHSGVTGATGLGVLVTGDVGSSPTSTISNFPPSSTVLPFIVHYAIDGVVNQAHADAITAYNALAIQGPGTVLADNLATVGPLTAGVYSFTVGAPDLPASATLTLNGPGIFVFNVGSSLTANVLSHVAGTADPCNIYWRVGTSATLNGVNFWGTVIADASITLGAGANLTGRALAGTGATGAVTMAGSGGNTIGGCSVVVLATPSLSTVASPGVTLGAPVFDTATLSGGLAPTGTITFNLYGPNDAICDSTSKFTSTAIVNGNGTYTSASFTPFAIGTYRWRAGYSGDANNAAMLTACADVSESVIVSVLQPGVAGIPTLSGWGLMTLMVLVVLASIYRLRKL